MKNDLIIKVLDNFSVTLTKPTANVLIYEYYRQDAPHEQHDLVDKLVKAVNIDDLDKFYIDILPTYLSPHAMKFYLPAFLAELCKSNKKFTDYAGFVLANTYDPVSNTKQNVERLQEYKDILDLEQKEIVSLALDHVSSISRSHDSDSADQFSRISDFLMSR